MGIGNSGLKLEDFGASLGSEDIEDAVSYINQKVSEAQKNIIDIGKYVLDHFFDGDIETALSKNPYKNVSFQQLAQHPDLMINRATLSRAVGLYIQQEQILALDRRHAELLDQVSPTHQQVILPIKQSDAKVVLLQKAVEQELSTRALRKIVEAEKRKTKSNRGRKPLTSVQKVWLECYRATTKRAPYFPKDRDDFISRYDGTVPAGVKDSWLIEIEEALGYLRAIHESVNALTPIED